MRDRQEGKRLIREILKGRISSLARTKVISNLLKWNYGCIRKLNPELIPISETDAEGLLTRSRRVLRETSGIRWRYGPERVKEVSREVWRAFEPYGSIVGKTYLDLGCGSEHPYGTSSIMFLNGAAQTIALDKKDTHKVRAAEALYDLIADCAVDPDGWHFSNIHRQQFLQNVHRFNAAGLRKGCLDIGLANVPLRHEVCDFVSSNLMDHSIDLVSSRSVLQYFPDFPRALSELKRIMAPGGIAYHHIDLTDCRVYGSPEEYHPWSFLTEEAWPEWKQNRFRHSEIRTCFLKAGFEILRFEGREEKMPERIRKNLKGKFREITDEDLNNTGVFCVVRKPGPGAK
jgi:SAM-dependent methyltransferase